MKAKISRAYQQPGRVSDDLVGASLAAPMARKTGEVHVPGGGEDERRQMPFRWGTAMPRRTAASTTRSKV
jgi:hypothetical protein